MDRLRVEPRQLGRELPARECETIAPQIEPTQARSSAGMEKRRRAAAGAATLSSGSAVSDIGGGY